MLMIVASACLMIAQASTNGAQVPTDSFGDPLPQGALLRLGSQRFRHPTSVDDLALSPDEKTIVTISSDELIVWTAAIGKIQWRTNLKDHAIALPGASYGVRSLAFDSDSSRFYTPGGPGQVFVWDVNSGKHEVLSLARTPPIEKVNQLPNREDSPKSIDVTSDGRRLAVGSSTGVMVCDEKGKLLFEVSNAPGRGQFQEMNNDRLMFGGDYGSGRFSPDQKLLAVVLSESPAELRLLDLQTGNELRRFKLKSRLVRFAFSPDSRHIVTSERDIAVRLYEVDSGKEIWSFEIEPTTTAESYISTVGYCPDANLIAACAPIGPDNDILLLDAATGKQVGKLSGHTWKPWALAAATKSNLLYSSGWDGAIRRWKVDERKQLPLLQGVWATGAVAASPDGRVLAYADDSGTIHLVNASDGKESRTLERPGAACSQLTFSPDSKQLAGGGTISDQVCVAVWDLSSGDIIRYWEWPKGRDPHSDIESLCFRPDGTQLAAAVFRQSAAYLWDITTGDQVAQLNHDHIYGLSYSADGKTLATAGWDKIVRFWETSRGETRRQLNVEEAAGKGDQRMYAVCYSPNGGLFATAHLDGTVRIWNEADLTLRKGFKVAGRFIFGSICFSPDGSLLATGSMGGVVALWDPYTAELLCNVGRHESYVYNVTFRADDRTLVTGGSDGVCYLWDLQPGGEQPEQDLNSLWKELASDGKTAYRAMRAMTQAPDDTVVYLGQKLRPVVRLLDLDRMLTGLSAEEAELRTRLVRVLVEKNDTVALSIVARRAITLLNQLGTPDSMRLLRELGDRDPESELGRMATAAVRRPGVP